MKTATISHYYQHEMCDGECQTESHLHSIHRRVCSTTMAVPLGWQTQHFIQTVSLPVEL